MPGKTISEKILSKKAHRDARAGDIVICDVDCAMGTDGSTPMAIDYFDQMGGTRVFDPDRIVFVLDHYSGCPLSKGAELHGLMTAFAAKHRITVFGAGEGICHQLLVERGCIRPGDLVVGADSHSVTGGALNAFATGIGSSDLAATMICGRIWLKVPHSIRVILEGELQPGVYAKDIALALASRIGAGGANYQALEFHGPAAAGLQLEDRLVLSNMSVEMGAKAGIFCADGITSAYLARRVAGKLTPVGPDPDAVYVRELVLDVSGLSPQIACPHAVDNVVELRQVAGTPIQMVYLGTCTGGRARDFHQAMAILDVRGRIAAGVKLIATPASKEIERELRDDGTIAKLIRLGAIITPAGCGSCCGTAGPVPDDGVNVLSTANRNFKARMGNSRAAIFLGSPAACAAAAVTGRIADPRDLMQGLP